MISLIFYSSLIISCMIMMGVMSDLGNYGHPCSSTAPVRQARWHTGDLELLSKVTQFGECCNREFSCIRALLSKCGMQPALSGLGSGVNWVLGPFSPAAVFWAGRYSRIQPFALSLSFTQKYFLAACSVPSIVLAASDLLGTVIVKVSAGNGFPDGRGQRAKGRCHCYQGRFLQRPLCMLGSCSGVPLLPLAGSPGGGLAISIRHNE